MNNKPTANSYSRAVERALRAAHCIVLLLSLALILFISYDTFARIPFLENHVYMTFQFWVCVVYLLVFVVELALRRDRGRYFFSHFLFLFLAVPYLNIISYFDIQLPKETLFFIRFIPLARGAYSLAIVVGYLSSNKSTNLFTGYASILFAFIYFASLTFYEQERLINSDVHSYWDALWWACMNVTTIGCYINPMSVAGKICGATLAACGMLMLPLFTVFVSGYVRRSRGEVVD